MYECLSCIILKRMLNFTILRVISGIGVCSVDFSPINQSTTSWVAVVIAISTCLPYCIAIFATSSLFYTSRELPTRHQVYHQCIVFLIGCALGLLSAGVYYYTAFLSLYELHGSKTMHLVGNILYNTSGCWFIMCYMLSPCFLCIFRSGSTML